MPKIKLPRKSTIIDMTAMCDMAFLLLTFFMLTTKFRPEEPVIVDTPSSVSEIKLPDTDILTITVDDGGRIFFGIDGQHTRQQMINYMGQKYNLNLTDEEIYQFTLLSTFGMPVNGLKSYLHLRPDERTAVFAPGMPCDSLSNELAEWIVAARLSNPKLRIAIKADGKTKYPVIKQVIGTLQEKKINKFNLITDLEAAPVLAGSVKP